MTPGQDPVSNSQVGAILDLFISLRDKRLNRPELSEVKRVFM